MLEPEPTARLGLIVPSSNRLTEPQMRRYAPSALEIHVTRLRMTGQHHVPLLELLPRIEEATGALDDAHCDVIVFHCTASSMEAGIAGEQQVLETMRAATGASIATTATATLAALRTLGLRRVALFSPYVADTHAHELAFLSEAGIEVVGGQCLDLSGGDAYLQVSASEWLDLTLRATPPGADGVFLSCTNIHAPPVIEPLERGLGRPVVTSNQAVLWYALRACRLTEAVLGLGRLFELAGAAGHMARRSSRTCGDSSSRASSAWQSC
jgi:maleate cis-trans isomerase